jgi:hypothetical protein
MHGSKQGYVQEAWEEPLNIATLNIARLAKEIQRYTASNKNIVWRQRGQRTGGAGGGP